MRFTITADFGDDDCMNGAILVAGERYA